MNSNGRELWTTRSWSWSGWSRGLGALNLIPLSCLLISVSVGSSPLSYLVTSLLRFVYYTAPRSGTEPIWYVTHRRPFTEIAPKSLFVSGNRSPIQCGFRADAKVIRCSVNIELGYRHDGHANFFTFLNNFSHIQLLSTLL